ncbi:MAG: hypothetical protein U0521_23450 [Anaerolineae bacterium]
MGVAAGSGVGVRVGRGGGCTRGSPLRSSAVWTMLGRPARCPTVPSQPDP